MAKRRPKRTRTIAMESVVVSAPANVSTDQHELLAARVVATSVATSVVSQDVGSSLSRRSTAAFDG